MSERKNPEDRAHQGKLVYEDIPICWDGKIRGPRLPSNRNWCRATKRWWETIRRSAQAMAFQETDWLHMLDTAVLHNKLWGYDKITDKFGNEYHATVKASEAATLAGEIRRRCESYGFTWADRRKYGISVTTPEQAAQEAEQATKSAIDYRARLNGLT